METIAIVIVIVVTIVIVIIITIVMIIAIISIIQPPLPESGLPHIKEIVVDALTLDAFSQHLGAELESLHLALESLLVHR